MGLWAIHQLSASSRRADVRTDKIGHITKVFRSKSQKQSEWSVKQITTVSSEIPHDVHDDQYDLYHFSATSKPSPLQVSLEVERQNVMLENDTGASVCHLYGRTPMTVARSCCTNNGYPIHYCMPDKVIDG